MIDSVLALALCCTVLSLVVAALSASVPALWFLYLRQAGKLDRAEGRLAAVEKDVGQLDAVVGRLCRAANLEPDTARTQT